MIQKILKPESEWKKILTPKQYNILREKGTELAFSGELLDKKDKGFYHCIACDNKLFSSETKFDSETGWPSFFAPFSDEAVIIKPYKGEGLDGAEVLCASCEGHLGHLFLDGPKLTGKRFCMNSAILTFKKY